MHQNMKLRGVEINSSNVITLVVKNRKTERASAAPTHRSRMYSEFLKRTRRIEKEAIVHTLL